MSQGTKEEFYVHVLKSFINREGGRGERAQFVRDTSVFKRPNVGGNLGRKAEPVLILMKHCLFKARKKVGLKTNNML
jgi:hypothetical protein